jgi:hypothetical protein
LLFVGDNLLLLESRNHSSPIFIDVISSEIISNENKNKKLKKILNHIDFDKIVME